LLKKQNRSGFFSFSSFFLVCFGLWIYQPACADSDYGGTYVQASIAEPNNLIPILATDSTSQSVVAKVFNGLLKYNPDIELEGDLASSWDIQDDGKTIVFHLKKDVLWHDLKPFTAADVQFTYEKLVDPEMPSPYGGDFEKVESFEVMDDFTVKISYGEAFSPGLASWTMSIMPKHLLEKEDFLKTKFSRAPIGTGPYRFRRWITGERVELVAFEDYFEGRPNLDRIVYRMIPDQTTMFLELHQETVDAVTLTPLQFSRQTDTEYFERHYQKFRFPNFGYTYFGFNLKNPLFQDKRVRRAILHAMNIKEIIDGVLLGLGRVATGPFTPESWAYNQKIRLAKFDPSRAKRMLTEAGWVDTNGDGIVDKEGQKFSFTVIVNQGNAQRQQAAELIQRWLKVIGMDVKIKVLEWSAFLKQVVNERRFEAVLLGWGLSRDPDPYDIWHSDKIKEGGFNFIGFSHARVDELIEAGRRTFNLDERKAIYHEIHEILYEEQPVIFLYIADVTPMIHRRFKNVDVTPIGVGYDFNDWKVSANDRKYTRFQL